MDDDTAKERAFSIILHLSGLKKFRQDLKHFQWKSVISQCAKVQRFLFNLRLPFLPNLLFTIKKIKGSVHSEFLIFVMIKCVFLNDLRSKTMTCYTFSVRPTILEFKM